MKKVILLLTLAISTTLSFAQAKYIFYFIGDGMGFGAVTLTEDYLAAQEGKHGSKNLTFSDFPVTGFATTYSASNLVTCSAASGTALACGSKTKNGRIGVNQDATQSFKSIAYRLKEKGYKVGITTSVSIDHATPATFYAHQPSRSMYYEIAREIATSNFDFFSGGGFLQPKGKDELQEDIFELVEKNGYKVVRSLADGKAAAAQKLILIQPEGKSPKSYPYVIDKTKEDYTLAQTTTLAIEKLENKKGFFLMVEGGKIDWASHDNDAATMIGEMVDMSDAVKVALDFYKKYPKQTLIVVTADHETGGLGVGSAENKLVGIMGFAQQKASVEQLKERVKQGVSYNELKLWITQNTGAPFDYKDELQLRQLFSDCIAKDPESDNTTCKIRDNIKLYRSVMRMVSAKNGGSYSTFGHTGTMVPVYAIGAGSELFKGKIDNTDIPKKMMKAAGMKWE